MLRLGRQLKKSVNFVLKNGPTLAYFCLFSFFSDIFFTEIMKASRGGGSNSNRRGRRQAGVNGGDLCSSGCEFESQRRILDCSAF